MATNVKNTKNNCNFNTFFGTFSTIFCVLGCEIISLFQPNKINSDFRME
ncbi:hypothetical protein NTHI1209_01528 [Haemophilus influenzae]|uniref:Uncharacterized protein n=1 Tax=Haemophilus influenzae TaxID=727 RepID=A0A158SYG6_HAEIF|nr:hypothetical protein NTHI1209_01528 [Haemophilus influenzae]